MAAGFALLPHCCPLDAEGRGRGVQTVLQLLHSCLAYEPDPPYAGATPSTVEGSVSTIVRTEPTPGWKALSATSMVTLVVVSHEPAIGIAVIPPVTAGEPGRWSSRTVVFPMILVAGCCLDLARSLHELVNAVVSRKVFRTKRTLSTQFLCLMRSCNAVTAWCLSSSVSCSHCVTASQSRRGPRRAPAHLVLGRPIVTACSGLQLSDGLLLQCN